MRIVALLVMVLVGGCSHQQGSTIDVTYCDPSTRKDCMSLSPELIKSLAHDSIENEKLKAALRVCQKNGL